MVARRAVVPQGPGHKCSGGRPGVHLRAISYYTLGSSSLHPSDR